MSRRTGHDLKAGRSLHLFAVIIAAVSFSACFNQDFSFKSGDEIIAARDPAGGSAGIGGPAATGPLEAYRTTVYKITRRDCVSCHRTFFEPKHASDNLEKAYQAAKLNVNFGKPAQSRLVERSKDAHCGKPQCSGNGKAMTAAIRIWAEAELAAGAPADAGNSDTCAADDFPTVPARIRRLNRTEYDNTLEAILGNTDRLGSNLTADSVVAGYRNNADSLHVNLLFVENLQSNAEQLASKHLDQLTGSGKPYACSSGSSQGQQTCANHFIHDFGRKAFRRPIEAEEASGLLEVYLSAKSAGGNHKDGIKLVLAAMLQSPHFIYQTELGDPAAQTGSGPIQLTQHEIASKLSYLIQGTPPDAILSEKADTPGALDDPDEIEIETERLLATDAAKNQMNRFFFEWLGLDSIDLASKNSNAYPSFTATLKGHMRTETERFISDVVFSGDGRLSTLLTADYTFVNSALANHYGISGVSGSHFRKVSVDPSRRKGLLSHASFLSVYSGSMESSPVLRGHVIRTRLFCQHLPPPPPELVIPPLPQDFGTLTTRQRNAVHSDDPSCAACHYLLDPIGFGFENFDAIGRFRQTDNDQPVDPSGEIIGTLTTNGPFGDGITLMERLGLSSDVEGCFATNYVRFAEGRVESEADKCGLRTLKSRFADESGNIPALIRHVTRSPAFVTRIREE